MATRMQFGPCVFSLSAGPRADRDRPNSREIKLGRSFAPGRAVKG